MKPKNVLRKRIYNFWTIAASAFVVLSVLVTASSIGAAAKPRAIAELALYNGADRQQLLEEGARKEGTLTFYTSGILTQNVRPIVDAFQKTYPFIKVQIWRASTTGLLPKVLEETSAGSYIFDVLESTEMTQMTLQGSGVTQPFYSPNLVYIEEGGITKAPGGGAFRVGFRESGIVLGYNTKLITRKELPQSHEGLLDPKWKGKIPITIDVASRSWMGSMLVTYGEQFVEKMAKQDFPVHTATAAAVLDMIIGGEYPFSPVMFDSHVTNAKKQGAPVDWIAHEPVPVSVGQVCLSKHSPHPHASLLFIDFHLSKKVGEIVKGTGYVSPRIDVPGQPKYKKYYGVKSTEEGVALYRLFDKLFLKK